MINYTHIGLTFLRDVDFKIIRPSLHHQQAWWV